MIINPAAFDIVNFVRQDRPAGQFGRAYRATVTKRRKVIIYIPAICGNPSDIVRINVAEGRFGEELRTGTKVVVVVEKDPNQQEVLNVYRAGEYDNRKKRKNKINPVRSRKKVVSKGKKCMMPVHLGALDILDAAEGKELELFGRDYEATITEGPRGNGTCTLRFRQRDSSLARFKRFHITKAVMKKKNVKNKTAIIRVEKDANHGQVIRVYLKEELAQKRSPGKAKPLVTYRYFPSGTKFIKGKKNKKPVCVPVNLAALDIGAYYSGGVVFHSVAERSLRIPVTAQKSGDKRSRLQYYAKAQVGVGKKAKINFFLSNAAGDIFGAEGVERYVIAKLKEDPDYGTYIELSRNGFVLNRYYHFRDRDECTSVDFDIMALIDYAYGKKNTKGKAMAPRSYLYPGKIYDRSTLSLSHKGYIAEVNGLIGLKGMQPIFVPVKDKELGYRINVYDWSKYKKDKKVKPEEVLVRLEYTNKFVPLKKVDIYLANELMDFGFIYTAEEFIKRYIEAFGTNILTRSYAKKLGPLHDSALGLKNTLKQMNGDEKITFYLNALADSILTRKKDYEAEALRFFKGIIASPAGAEKLARLLPELLNFSNNEMSNALMNSAILIVLAELPAEYKTFDLVTNAVRFLDYEGAYQRKIRRGGEAFFASIPEELQFMASLEKDTALEKYFDEYIKHGVNGEMDNIFYYKTRVMGRFPLLTPIGEITNGALAQCGRLSSEQNLVNSNLRLLFILAMQHRWLKIPFMELVDEGHVALSESAKRWKPNNGTKFSTYAGRAIINNFFAYYTSKHNHVRLPAKRRQEVNNFIKKCLYYKIDPYSKRMDPLLVGGPIGMPPEKVEKIRKMLFTVAHLSQQSGYREEGKRDSTLESSLGVSHKLPEEEETYSRNRMTRLLNLTEIRLMELWEGKDSKDSKLSMFRAWIASFRGGKAANLTQIADRHGFSRAWSSFVIHNEVLPVMREVAKECGYTREDFRALSKPASYENGNPAEALRAVYENLGFNEFSKKDKLYPLREKNENTLYAESTVDMEVRILRKLGILIMVKPGIYKLNGALKGSLPAETEKNIKAVYNTRMKINAGYRKQYPLWRYSIPQEKVHAVKEMVKIELNHRNLEEALAKQLHDRSVIKIWSGYARSSEAKKTLQKIRDVLPKIGYDIDCVDMQDEKRSLMELVDFALSPAGRRSNTVTILPYNNSYVAEHITSLKESNVIFMDFPENAASPDTFSHIEGIIATGVAYINRNDAALSNLYRLLTGNNGIVSVRQLKEDPSKLVFIFEPVKSIDYDDLNQLNSRMRELILSV
ncbi:MAG: hypothetical protein JW994_02505 [Candidatus Omnitrophica bacterium]|nr:hypothetical protein [Candidatus Omnitrophota bacterium]